MMNKSIGSLLVFFLCFHSVYKIHAQDKSHETISVNTAAGKHVPGDNFGGGKIFWLDETGQHGLVAAPTDQSAGGIAWNPGKAIVSGASEDVLYSGQKNSEKIVAVQGNTLQYAAKLCLDFSTTVNNVVYSDWYLPSRFELNLLYQQKTAVGGFNQTSGIYWSSTESALTPGTMAWEQEFKFGSQHEDDKDLPDQVRCIRKF
ncbi:MAG: DUF1566 domain-containing protein [Bacteroidetes bacterium]|nr:DUF1566 domain-containing protein [Bacteroidota bacterium]